MNVCSVSGCDLKVYGHGWCSKHYMRWKRNGDPTVRLRAKRGGTHEEKFRHFMPGDPPRDGSCWEWAGSTNDKGYGIFMSADRKPIRAHRVAYQIFKGEEPGPVLRHTCDNPPCCNPDHLLQGTFEDNSRDMVERGRSRTGQRHPHAKLTDADVIEMRRLREEGVTLPELAAVYGIAKSNVHFIVTRQTWRHLP